MTGTKDAASKHNGAGQNNMFGTRCAVTVPDIIMVRGTGLEPARVSPLEPKSSASAISPSARTVHNIYHQPPFQPDMKIPPRLSGKCVSEAGGIT